MSIASEIQALNTNLAAAKDAVVDKGGTVGDTGLAGLASEISNIPGGGGSLPPYGQVGYYWDVRDIYTAEGMMCTVTITNMTTYGAFYETAFGSSGGGMNQLEYQNDHWMYYDWEDPDDPEKIIPDITAIGLSVVFEDPDNPFGQIMCGKSREIHKESGTTTIGLNTLSEFNGLASVDGDNNYTIGTESIYAPSVAKYSFGSSVTSLPNSFLAAAGTNVESIDYTYATNVTTIGTYVVLGAKSFVSFSALTSIGDGSKIHGAAISAPELLTIGNSVSFDNVSELILPKVTSIGNSFTAQKAINIGLESVETIGNSFNATNVAWVYIPNIRTIGNNFLNNLKQYSIRMSSFYQSSGTNQITIGQSFLANGNFSTLLPAGTTPTAAPAGNFIFGAGITSIGISLMQDCKNFIGTLTMYCPASVVSGTANQDYNVMSAKWIGTSTATCTEPIYVKGFKFSGTERNSWATRFPTVAKYTVSGNTYISRKVSTEA